jgi:hypothetical protein
MKKSEYSPANNTPSALSNAPRLQACLAFLQMRQRAFTKSSVLKISARLGFLLAPQLVLMAAGIYDHAANASGGLVGSAVDPAFGQVNEVGMIADYGYDTARDCCRVITALSTIPASMAGAKIVFSFAYEGNAMGNASRGIFTALAVTFGFPTVIHLLGTFAINNFGGLGGGL